MPDHDTPDHETPNHEIPDNGRDLGEPITSLGALEIPASADFFDRVRRKVWRHETITEFVIFSLETPGPIFVEFAALLASTLKAAGSNAGRRP